MVHFKSLLVALAAVSTAVGSPCKPKTTSSVLDTTTTTSIAETTTIADYTVTTQTSSVEETTSVVTETSKADDTTTAPTATTTDGAHSTTTTAAETTSSAAAPLQCGIGGSFVFGNQAGSLGSAGQKNSVGECLQACQATTGCQFVAFYDLSLDFNPGLCQLYTEGLMVNGAETIWKWYELGCPTSSPATTTTEVGTTTATAAERTSVMPPP